MKYETVKKYAIPETYVVVQTNAFEKSIYAGRVEELTTAHLALNPAGNQSWIWNSPAPSDIETFKNGIPIAIDLESIIAIGKMPSPKEVSE